MIIGNDLMEKLGIELSFKEHVIKWNEMEALIKQCGSITDKNFAKLYTISIKNL